MFGELSPEEFLERHWQRSPVLFRGALPGFRSPIDPDELAGLACEQEVESRLVQGHIGSRFSLEHGPFEETRFTELPPRDWTLLVQDVDKHVPDVGALLEPFRFIPDWRIDDIMVSFAAPGGSVGPHTDQYDVFLLQAQGRRRWQLSERFDPRLRDDCDLKVLEHFQPEQQFVVEPGDLLYLPPNVAHFGLALDEAVTLSIGFRAPDQRELCLALGDAVSERANPNARFSDPGRKRPARPAQIESADLARLRQLIRDAAVLDDLALDRVIAGYLTRPKPHLEEHGPDTTEKQLLRRLNAGARLTRRPGSRWAYLKHGEAWALYADGEEYPLTSADLDWVERVCRGSDIGSEVLAADPGTAARLAKLIARASLDWVED